VVAWSVSQELDISNKTDNVCINVSMRRLRVTSAIKAQKLSHYLSVALVTQHAMRMSHFVNLWPV